MPNNEIKIGSRNLGGGIKEGISVAQGTRKKKQVTDDDECLSTAP